jgi:hypothetical protein
MSWPYQYDWFVSGGGEPLDALQQSIAEKQAVASTGYSILSAVAGDPTYWNTQYRRPTKKNAGARTPHNRSAFSNSNRRMSL